MAARARDYTLLEVAKYNRWLWAYGPDIDKGHRHQLHHDDYLAKAPVSTSRVPGARGPMLNAAAFGITLEGFLHLMKVFPDSEILQPMKKELFDAVFGDEEVIWRYIKEREAPRYRFRRHNIYLFER